MVAREHHDELVNELLSKPVGPLRAPSVSEVDFTREIEVDRDTVVATIRDDVGKVDADTAREFLLQEGLDLAEWEATGFRKSRWGDEANPRESVRFTYKRKRSLEREDLGLDELLGSLEHYSAAGRFKNSGPYGALVLIGDMQFGKTDGDGVAGTLRRTIGCIERAADRIDELGILHDIGHIHVGWLGDHIEGFVSQGGANAWRTDLSLNEQIRLTRRSMLHALTTFAPMAEKVSMAAVPGNHGEAIRFNGKGVTRYDDSHDTESLIAVHDAAKLSGQFEHVQFYVPETDELTVLVDVAGTAVAHAHGHQWRPGQHFQWWKGQAFNKASAMHEADLLVAGHLHHEETDSDGPRQYIGVPAMELESTWFRHSTGTAGAPGLVLALTKDGLTDHKEIIR